MVARANLNAMKEKVGRTENGIRLIEEERDLYRKQAGYRRTLDLKYEQNKHIYEVAEERYAQLQKKQKDSLKELGKVNVKITNARVKLFEAEEEISSKKKRLEQLSISVEEKQKKLCALLNGSKAEILKRVAEAEEELKSKKKAIIKAEIATYIEESERLQNKIEEQNNVLNNIQAEILKRVEEAKQNIMLEPDADVVNAKIARAWADYKCLIYERVVDRLLIKPHPISIGTAIEFKASIKQLKEDALIPYKATEYKLKYLLSLFPELEKYVDENVIIERDKARDEGAEEVRREYLTQEEWTTLSEGEKSQLALDKYNEQRKRSNAQVGRDYEEYVAYLFRERLKGCNVIMFGEERGLEDLGRDIIVKHRDKVYLVQCKRWSQEKIIREKHIMQLFGSTVEYANADLHKVGKQIIPVFVSTTRFSPTAERFAKCLGIVIAQQSIGDYPQIKCNISRDGRKIYHLPFDQQYNSTKIDHNNGEFMAWTVKEAEERGFRRAKRYIGEL